MIGFWPANAEGDDILLFGDKARKFPIATLHTLRQQMAREQGRPNLALADFIAPKGAPDLYRRLRGDRGPRRRDACQSLRSAPRTITPPSCCARWPTGWPKPSPSACTSACGSEFWGYAPDENLTNDELIAETYRGIRPAPGYPAQPDHTEKGTLFKLLDAEARSASS